MNDAEREQVERLQDMICMLSPGQVEVLRAWVMSSYDVRGNRIKYTEDVPGFDFLKNKRAK